MADSPTVPPSVATPTAAAPYAGTSGEPLQTIQGPSATAPQPTSLAGSVWPVLPNALGNQQFKMTTAGEPGEKKGTGKGTHDPNLTKIGDLVRVVDAVHSGNFSGINPATLTDILNKAGVKDVDAASLIDGSAYAGDTAQAWNAVFGPKVEKSVVGVAWKQLMKELPAQGIGTSLSMRTVPDVSEIPEAIKAVGNLSINPHTLAHLQYQGRNTSTLSTVADLVQANDQLAKASPGAEENIPGKAGVPAFQSGKSYYQQMMNDYHANNAQGTQLVTSLNALGFLDITDAVPDGKSVGAGVQKLMKASYAAGLTPGQYSAEAESGTLPKEFQQGLPDRTESVDRAYVDHVADAVGIPISQSARISIANSLAQMPAGVDSEDWVAQMVTAAATSHVQQNPTLDIDNYSGMALGIAETIRASYAAQGIALTSTALNQGIAKTLASKPTTVYQANEVAQGVGSQQARDLAASQYTALAPQINQDVPVSTLAAPYLATAEKTLGVSAQEMNITDPQWMKWAEGGADGKSLMSQSEWAHTLMTDPQYGFANSQPNKNLMASGSLNILQSLGMIPSGAASFDNSSTAGLGSTTGT